MKVLVTGANGFLGQNIVFELLKRQHNVHIIVRNKKNIYFDLKQVHVVEGNFTDYDTLVLAARNCEAIIHVAAVTSTQMLHYTDYKKTNVEGTARIIRVADELKINNIVYVSTSNTIGYGTEQKPADEHSKIETPFSKSYYAQSKAECESIIVEAAEKPNQHIITINPSFMIGPFDTKPSSGKLLIMGYKKKVLFIPKGGKNFVAVNDVAKAACNALTLGKNGERYLTSGINLSFKEYYLLQKKIANYKQLIIELPDSLILAFGLIGDLVRKLGIETEICTMNLKQLLVKEYYNNHKAKEQLLLPQTELQVAIKEAIYWFKEKNMIS